MDNTLKSKIDNLWQFLWNSGMANPLTNLQQITYLIFIKMLDDKQITDEKRLNTIPMALHRMALTLASSVSVKSTMTSFPAYCTE